MKVDRQIIFYKNHFWDFYSSVIDKTKDKIDFVLSLIKTVEKIPLKFFKHIEDTDGLYEIRVEVGSNIYRIFCCFDQSNLVVLFNGFHKKSQKTPRQEIALAEKLKKEYFETKGK
ncbi:MAG: type II toxin-antitoxin system RelE/ParE family toxin [Saprospiraceae bacterium]|nr:type II toxin-antitoxin system RelE/ParE family toxin [Pyrinomonadaceae bacterium]